jgi:hypothetical protein
VTVDEHQYLAERFEANRTHQREIVAAFLAASRSGDFQAPLVLLDPDVVLRADAAAVQAGASKEVSYSPSRSRVGELSPSSSSPTRSG